MAIVDPRSWQFLSWKDLTAWLDFLGAHDLQTRATIAVLRASKGTLVPIVPLGDGSLVETLGGRPLVFRGPTNEWHQAHQNIHDSMDKALGVATVDLRSYNLDDPNEFATWSWLHGGLHVSERLTLGV